MRFINHFCVVSYPTSVFVTQQSGMFRDTFQIIPYLPGPVYPAYMLPLHLSPFAQIYSDTCCTSQPLLCIEQTFSSYSL